MAAEPLLSPELLAKFGPLKAYPTGQRIDSSVDPDRLVKTHCCFCGQQCGIQLKVKGNEVIGFEPWEEFPFNKGMLCPKGVRRYLQGAHPDRLTRAYFRDPSSPEGFRAKVRRPSGGESATRSCARRWRPSSRGRPRIAA